LAFCFNVILDSTIFAPIGMDWPFLRICLNFVTRVKKDEFCALMQYIFECIAKAMDEKITKIRVEKSFF